MLDKLTTIGPFHRTISYPRRRDGFHIMPTSAGHEIARGPGYDWNGDSRGSTPFSILQHSIAGSGRLRYEQNTVEVGPGRTMLVTIPHDHRYWLARDEEWSFFWIAFSGQEALRLHRAIITAVGPVFRLSSDTLDLLAEICLKLQAGVQTAGEASFLAYRATMALYDEIMIHEAIPGTAHDPDIERVVHFVRTNLSEALDVLRLSAVAGMSPAHFSRVFKKHRGIGPAEFVLQERMERAAKLLSDSRLNVRRVSVACGFSDPNYFSKVFRRTFSISPVQFRSTGMFASHRQDQARNAIGEGAAKNRR